MILKTKKFLLRPFRNSDLGALVRNINDPAVSRNTTNIPYPYTLRDGQAWLQKRLQAQRTTRRVLDLAIVIKREMVGSVGFRQVAGGRAHIGYWLGRRYWNRGIMTEAVGLAVKYGFAKLHLKKIFANVYPANAASRRVLEKNGFQPAGIVRQFIKKRNRYLNLRRFVKNK